MSSLDSQTAGGLIPPLTLAGTSTPLAHQVAGHQNVRADASGSLVIKVPSQLSWLCVIKLTTQPSLPKEIALYQMVNAAPRSSKLARLKRYIPQFFGTLRLEGRMDDVGQFQPDAEADIPELSSYFWNKERTRADETERGTPELVSCIHKTEHHGC